VLKALITQPHRDAEGAGSVVAEDDDWGVGVEFGMGAGGNFSHGNEGGVGEVGGLVLPGFTDVQQERGIGLLAEGCEGFCGNFGLWHDFKDILRDGIRHRARYRASTKSC